MPRNALIGHTGFVGGTLYRERPFAAAYNSGNIEEIRGQVFDTVVCAGVSAVKWLANKEPERDWQGISRLIDCLRAVEARHFVLISTIDVYARPIGLTERDRPETAGLYPYGLHRLRLEDFVAECFPSHAVVRLPALFGAGLKKNAVYDLIHLNQMDKIPSNGRFQLYPTRRLADDLDRIEAASVPLVNITTEPVEMETIRARFFPDLAIGMPLDPPPLYDLRSIHDGLLGGYGGYHLDAGAVLDELAAFIAAERGQG
jgi:hypothetical protein